MHDPFISFVIPVLNAEKILAACLKSIRNQDYPGDRYEILVADGGSTDRTLELAREYGATLIDAKGMLAEPAKHLCFQKAQGAYLVLLDADNEIASSDWLRKGVAALEKHPEALGFESYYLKHPQDTHLNRYLTGLLQISDPVARTMASRLILVNESDDGTQQFRLPSNGAYPTGANGFIFRQELIRTLRPDEPYHEATFFPKLIREGYSTLIKIRNVGVYHHYVTTFRDYFKKRRRAIIIYMLRKEENIETWDQKGFNLRKCMAIAFNASVLGPLGVGLYHALTRRDAEWLIHVPASMISVVGSTYGMVEYWLTGSAIKNKKKAQSLSSTHTAIREK